MEASTAAMWGSWEELVLGGAVLRHGTAAWDAVAAEIRSRTLLPALFTPQACEAKYEDIQERYSGCDAWFEELRKQRLAELKRKLEKSEDSIGSLQSKLESLNSESSGYNTSRTRSPSCNEKTEDLDSSSKEACRDESSAGSYMGDTGRECSQECEISPSVSSQDNHSKEDTHSMNITSRGFDITQGIIRKKRGQRKRKGCTIVKEGSMEESGTVVVDRKDPLLGCGQDVGAGMVVVDRKDPLLGCGQDVGAPQEELLVSCKSTGEPNEASCENVQYKHSASFLTNIMDSITEQKGVSIFARRLETQKRARYKKMIKRHVDLRIVSLRISDGSITSAKELFRDLLLLATNAIVFYPKGSPEHESAINLRRLVTQALHEHVRNPISSDGNSAVPAQVESKSIETQSLQACSSKDPESVLNGNVDESLALENGKKNDCHEEARAESLARKRVIVSKRGLVNGKRGRETSDKGRKRARRRL